MATRGISEAFNRVYYQLPDWKKEDLLNTYRRAAGASYQDLFQQLFNAYMEQDFKKIERWESKAFYALTGLALNEGTLSAVQFGTMRIFRQTMKIHHDRAIFVPYFGSPSDSSVKNNPWKWNWSDHLPYTHPEELLVNEHARKWIAASIFHKTNSSELSKEEEDKFIAFEKTCSELPKYEQGFFVVKSSFRELRHTFNEMLDLERAPHMTSLVRFRDDNSISFDIIPSIGLVNAFAKTFFRDHAFQAEPMVGKLYNAHADQAEDIHELHELLEARQAKIIDISDEETPTFRYPLPFDPLESYSHSILLLIDSSRSRLMERTSTSS